MFACVCVCVIVLVCGWLVTLFKPQKPKARQAAVVRFLFCFPPPLCYHSILPRLTKTSNEKCRGKEIGVEKKRTHKLLVDKVVQIKTLRPNFGLCLDCQTGRAGPDRQTSGRGLKDNAQFEFAQLCIPCEHTMLDKGLPRLKNIKAELIGTYFITS